MKVGVVGCGAVGSYYGARLCAAGEDVHFLLRTDYATVRREGVRVQSVLGDFTARPHAASEPAEIGVCDVILIGLKTTANDEFSRLLPPLIGPDTLVATLQNGLGSDDRLAALFGPERVLGGLCFVCLNRVAPGVIRHLAHGRVVVGEYGRPSGERAESVAALFARAGVPCGVAADLAQARWEKLVWNIPFNGLGVAGCLGYDRVTCRTLPGPEPTGPCLTTADLLADPQWERLVEELMREVVATGRALGFPLADALVEENLARTRTMGPYKASTLLDFERHAAIEIESIFLEPRRRARRAGVATPRLDALCEILLELGRRRRFGASVPPPGGAGS